MPAELNVFALPQLAEPEELAGATAVVIDVLRASTTIVHALEAGAVDIIPCVEVEDAREIARQLPPGQFLLGGERGGLRIPGFDLGNSPREYLPEVVAGKTIVFTTTNGAKAAVHARHAAGVLIAAFVNVTAVIERLLARERICILCAGREGQFSRDDVLLAGMLVERMERRGGIMYALNAQAISARELWLHSFALPRALGAEPLPPEELAEQLRDSPGGRNLVAVGLEADILTAAQIDRFRSVPELNPRDGRIRLA